MKEGEPADCLRSKDFVEEVESCKCLYNKKSNDFKDKCKKHNSLEDCTCMNPKLIISLLFGFHLPFP